MLHTILHIIRHLDESLLLIIQYLGNWFYLFAFLIIFFECGVILTPFLPGDSFIFMLGMLAHSGHTHSFLLAPLLLIAAIIGNLFNYMVGHKIGHVVFSRPRRFINPKHLEQSRLFFEKYGEFAIFLGRFVPIVRTFVPFFAGLSEMNFRKFMIFSVISALAWIGVLFYASYYFGQFDFVKAHLSLIIYLIVLVSFMPVLFKFLCVRLRRTSR